jgi:TRAP-type C4-dicarboxylate transport system permease small subunit
VGSRSLRVQIPTWQVFVIVPSFLGMFFVRYLVEFWKLARNPMATLSSGVSEELSDEFIEEQLDVLESERAHSTTGDGDR